jgi:pimeloyl-ACP methyl ester carboxylesterase
MAIDLAGHGESGLGRTAWTMPSYGEDVVAVVEQLGLRDLVMVGHSMGGDIILGVRRAALPVVALNPDHGPTDVESLERQGVTAMFIPGVGHFPMLEDPDTFNRLLAEAIARFPAPVGS